MIPILGQTLKHGLIERRVLAVYFDDNTCDVQVVTGDRTYHCKMPWREWNRLIRTRTGKPVRTNSRTLAIQLAQRNLCYLCGNPMVATVTIEHIVPRSSGGMNRIGNVALAHLHCNNVKACRNPYGCEVLFGKILQWVIEEMPWLDRTWRAR